jgi:hypothetical protein
MSTAIGSNLMPDNIVASQGEQPETKSTITISYELKPIWTSPVKARRCLLPRGLRPWHV